MALVEKVQTYLSRLGIDATASDVYLCLLHIGPASALQVSKKSDISRTHCYRSLEQLEATGLVGHEKLTYGSLYRALPIENLEATLATRQAETTALQHELSNIGSLLRKMAGAPDDPASTVRHYYGLAGIKQASWNLTKASHEYYVYKTAHITKHLDAVFSRRIRERCRERGLISHDLTNSPAVTAAELEPFDPESTHYRYISPDILAIGFELYIYDETVSLIDYTPGAMQAVEIRSPLLAAMMQQLYLAVWRQAVPLVIQS